MEFSRDLNSSPYQIQSYQKGLIIVNGQSYTQPILIQTENLISPWGPASLAELSSEAFDRLFIAAPEVLLLGTGSRLIRPPLAVFKNLIDRHIGFEIMDTGAACRTYTLLTAEGRSVAAALFVI